VGEVPRPRPTGYRRHLTPYATALPAAASRRSLAVKPAQTLPAHSAGMYQEPSPAGQYLAATEDRPPTVRG